MLKKMFAGMNLASHKAENEIRLFIEVFDNRKRMPPATGSFAPAEDEPLNIPPGHR